MAARRAHNPKVASSSLASATINLIWPIGQAVKTPPFHGGNRGSIPLWVTKKCGCSSMVEFRPSKPAVRVRSPSPAPFYPGTIAQLGEHLPYKQGVTGSSPVSPTICGLVVQLVRMPACHAGGRGFESLPGRQLNIHYAGVAQR